MRQKPWKFLWPSLTILLLIWVNAEQICGQTASQPIELKDITLEYLVKAGGGTPVWKKLDSQNLGSVPHDALRLRATAKVTNRSAGTRIRLKAVMQETCYPLGPKKSFLVKMAHLTENAPGEEEQEIKPDGTVQAELPAHCDNCSYTACGKKCAHYHEQDHLGEGPHGLRLEASDLTAPSGDSAAVLKPQYFVLQFQSKCPPKPKWVKPNRADKRPRRR